MQIDKQDVINHLREIGDNEKVQEAERELPEKIDHELHTDKLEKLGVDPQKLISKL
jgi:hypothetical protein